MSTQAEIIEEAAQELAAWLGESFAEIHMLDHYLGRAEPINPRAAEIASRAAEIMRPTLEQLRAADVDRALKDHQLASCHAEFRNLADYVQALPDRLPKVGNDHTREELLSWLKREIEAAPIGRNQRTRR
ncbi:hypothetical protein [Pseudomonas sp. MWU12-2345]|uniref:hypothetical protein n=1 Tax=Pseudomonas sp. MWU12-2345 TaxID=2928689 RepID=UPI00201031D1|nr:hypothetical protein [Pseudomonas sp. MWU12-2345]